MSTTACQIAATGWRKGVQRGEISEAGTDRNDAALLRTSQACVAVCDFGGMLVMALAASNVPIPDFATWLLGRREVFRGKVDALTGYDALRWALIEALALFECARPRPKSRLHKVTVGGRCACRVADHLLVNWIGRYAPTNSTTMSYRTGFYRPLLERKTSELTGTGPIFAAVVRITILLR